MFVSGDKAKLTRGPLRNREVTLLYLLYESTEDFWQCSLTIDGIEMEFAVNEWDLEALGNG